MNEFLVFQELVKQNNMTQYQSETSDVHYDDILKFYSNNTYDGDLLHKFQTVFSANFTAYDDIFKDILVGENTNLEALRYYIHFISNFIEGINDPYPPTTPLLRELAFGSIKDEDITKYKKLDFLALMQFKKEEK